MTILFSIILTFPSYGSWEFITRHKSGTESYYLDFNSIKKIGNNVLYWTLTNYDEPLEEFTKYGQPNGYSKSLLMYIEGDCNRLGVKVLSYSSFRREMAEGDPWEVKNIKNPEQKYFLPNKEVPHLTMFKKVCNHIK